jgi:hypothetical protein
VFTFSSRHLVITPLALTFACVHAINIHAMTPRAEPVILFDFEDQGLSQSWTVSGSLHATRAEIPEPPPGNPTGHGVRVTVTNPSTLLTHSGMAPTDWTGYEALRFRVYRSPESVQQAPTALLRVRAREEDGNAAFVRRVDLDAGGWTEVTLPLRWFRWDDGRVPRWDRIDNVAFSFLTSGEYWLDEISVIPASGDQDRLHPSPAELAELAAEFGSEIQVIERDGIALVSAAPELDAEQLLAHLAEVRAAVLADMPFLVPPDRPIPLVVLPDQESFRAYVERVASAHAANASVPGLPGFTLMGVATSFWHDDHGTLRPVYTHEFVHALMSASAGLPNLTEWFQEGVAARYQWRFHPEAMDAAYIRRHMAAADGPRPLAELCLGEPIGIDDYWQAMTLVDLLVGHERFAPHLEMLLQRFRDAGTTDLRPHVGTVLGVTWAELGQDWRGDVARRYGSLGD